MKHLDQNPLASYQAIILLGKLTPDDIEIIGQCKSRVNKVGFSYQLTFVKIRNYFPKQSPFEIEAIILEYSASQLNLSADLIGQYQKKNSVIREHQLKIKQFLNLKTYDEHAKLLLSDYILQQAQQTDQVSLLIPKAQCFLKENNILQPALSTLRRIVGTHRDAARKAIENKIAALLSNNMKGKLFSLLDINETRSLLWRLKQPPRIPSADNIKYLMQHVMQLENTGIMIIDLTWLNNNYQKRLAKYGRTNSVYYLHRMPKNKCYAILVCFCQELYGQHIDYIVEMLVKLVDKAEKTAKNQIDEATKKKRRDIKKVLEQFQTISRIILNDEVTDETLRKTIFKEISRKHLIKQVEATDEWLNSKYGHAFHLLQARHNYFRQFFPKFIAQINLCSDGTGTCDELLSAIKLLQKLNDKKDNQCPEDAPIDFIPKSLSKFIIDSAGDIDRHGWETALLKAVRDEIKQGNLSVNNATFFGKFDQFFMPDDKWEPIRSAFFKAAELPVNAKDIPNYLKSILHRAIDQFVAMEKNNPYAKVENAQWALSVDEAQQFTDQEFDDLARLREFLKRNMRQIKLPDLLIDVDNDTHYTNYFLSYKQRQERNKEAIATVIVALMSRGCGIGDSTMQHLVEAISYHNLRTIGDLYLSDEDSQRYALRDIVDAISNLDITVHWGTGISSASDSIRMEYQGKVLNRGYSTCFGDYAIEFYTFVADNFAPYFSNPIECTNRDSGHVLDGVLYNESSLPLLNHYVDSHGYTEINYTAFTMIGKRLNPRIKNIKRQQLYCIDPSYELGSLAPLLKKNLGKLDVQLIASYLIC